MTHCDRRICRLPAGGVRFLPRAARQQRPGLVQAAQGGLRGRGAGAVPRAGRRASAAALGRGRDPAGRRPAARHLPHLSRRALLGRQAALQDACRRGADPLGRQARSRASSISMSSRASRWSAAGFWHPEPALLARLRRAILADPDGFLAIADAARRGAAIRSAERRAAEPPAARLRGGQGHAGRRLCLLEIVHRRMPR